MAAALRLLLLRRRGGRAESPSTPYLALLQPLLPVPYSKLSAPPVPSLLRRTSGEGCSALLPRKPTDRGREATQRPIQPSSPLLGVTATSSLLGIHRVQIQSSPPQVPSLIRHYSSKQPIVPQTSQHLKQAKSLDGAVDDFVEHLALVIKGMENCVKTSNLLDAGVDYDKVFAMFEKGLDDTLNAIAVCEKDLDFIAKAFRSNKEMRDVEQHQMMCKRIKNKLEAIRQELKESQRSCETQRTLEKIYKSLDFAATVLGAFVLLLLLLINMGICSS